MVRFKQRAQRYLVSDIGLLILTIALAAVAIVLGVPQLVVIVIAGWFVLAFLFMIALYQFAVMKAQKDYALLTSQNIWAHWTYRNDEWRAITENYSTKLRIKQQAASWRPSLLRGARLYGLIAFATTLMLLLSTGLLAIISATIVGFGIFLVFYRSAKRVELQQTEPYPLDGESDTDVYISKQGIAFPGSFILFTQPGIDIADISIEEQQPEVLRVHFIHHFAKSTIPFDLSLPIPLGYENEAALLKQRILVERERPQPKPSSA
jgi:hypothetical protein